MDPLSRQNGDLGTNGPVETLLDRIVERMGSHARANVVFGDPVERGGLTVIPVAKARWGFGGGGGSAIRPGDETGAKTGSGSGGGGGLAMSPVGFIEIRDGRAQYRQIVDPAAFVPVAIVVLVLAYLLVRRWHPGPT